MKSLLTFLMASFVLNFTVLKGQEVISSGGSHAQAAGVSLSWTVGEVVTATFSNGGYILTQGFHQSKLSASAIDDLPLPGLNLSVYPNPSDYLLNLRVKEGDYSQLRYTLLSAAGKTLITRPVKSDLTGIDMMPYTSGNYILLISKKSGETVKTFKVIKQ